VNQDRLPEQNDLAARDGIAPDDPARRDPLVVLLRMVPRRAWYGLAALALAGIGVLIGVFISSHAGAPVVEKGTVTWVNEGLPDAGGGTAVFLARLDGTRTARTFILANFVQWSTGENSTWQVPGSLPPIPACMVPARHGRKSRDGVGPVRAHIRFGVVHVPMPDGEQEDVAVWVECL
jgi:hypothetical protein